MRLHLLLRAGFALTSLLLASSCTFFDSTCDEEDRDCLSNPLFARGLNSECSRTGECKEGLYCIEGTCQFTGDTDRGDKCRLTGECGSSDFCGAARVCGAIEAAASEEGGDCESNAYCEHGLVCEPPNLAQLGTVSLGALAKLRGSCEEAGTKEQGQRCERISECVAGLACRELEEGKGKHCVSLIPLPFEPPALPEIWTGVKCPAVPSSDEKQSYFEVPRGGEPDPAEFYALPFPNDIRLQDGHLDLSGHPVPPNSFGVPFVERYIEVAQQDLDGFSTNPVVLFRFSHPYDFRSVDRSEVAVRIVDVTKSSAEYDREASIEWKTTSGDLSNYICPHWLGLRRPVGSPLRPGTTYAAIVTNALRACGERDSKGDCMGEDYARGEDFDAMLADSAPSDSALRAAWEKYAPLRAWIEDTGADADSILNATVFTTQEPETMVEKLREQVRGEMPPTISELTECESPDTVSPCEDADGRGACQAASDDFREFHGRIRLPVFQKGQRPYFALEDGGGIEVDGNGDPVIQDHLDVCFAMSVPNAPAPAAGYPVLVYAHGTGGTFNGEMDASGFAQTLATGDAPGVLVAIDLPQHGERRGDSTEEPEGLFYNFLNPRAARDNVLQGSADLMAVVYWVKEGGVIVDGDAFAFDTSRIALMGHSQGATHTSLMAPYEPDAIGVVLSGNGGHLSTSMLTKKSPVDIASVVPIGLMDPDNMFALAGGGYNPALALIQSVFDRSDPVNFGPRVRRVPLPSSQGAHLFMTYGLDDTYSPVETQRAYIAAAQLPVVTPQVDNQFDLGRYGLSLEAAPAEQNASVNGNVLTIGTRQYRPSSGGVDGHFVGVRAGEAGRVDVDRFLRDLMAGDPPSIGSN